MTTSKPTTFARYISVRYDERRVDTYEHTMRAEPATSQPFTTKHELLGALDRAMA